MNRSGKSLSELVADCVARFPASGEINRRVEDAAVVIGEIKTRYQAAALNVDFTDGLSLDMGQWRFNLRESNTEPVLRLNVESKADSALMEEKTAELLALIGGEPA